MVRSRRWLLAVVLGWPVVAACDGSGGEPRGAADAEAGSIPDAGGDATEGADAGDGGQVEDAGGGAGGACAPACDGETVCCPEGLPCAGRCVPDCRLGERPCPPEVPACDGDTGLCAPVAGVSSDVLAVVNPTSGVAWWAKAFFPQDASEEHAYPAIVSVPGGTGAGSQFEGQAEVLAARGFVVVVFDADGRGQTAGAEDQCGHVHQDGLAALIEAVARLPVVDGSRIGLWTSSFGITMGSGVLARHPELPVRFLVDVEGPADRDDTGGCDGSGTGHIEHDCADEAWWSEREAASFIAEVGVAYLRLQHVRDHAQPDNLHCIRMVNAATAAEHGGTGISSWTRVNSAADNEPNRTYGPDDPPQYVDNDTELDLPALWTELFAR